MLDLQPIKDRLAAATPGPWCVECATSEHLHDIALDYVIERAGSPIVIATVNDDEYVPITNIEAERNAKFICHSPTDISDLIAEVERLRTALASKETELELTATEAQWLRHDLNVAKEAR